MGVSEAVSLDIVSPQDRTTNNAIVDRTVGAAMRGAVTVLMNKPDADPQTREGDDIPLRRYPRFTASGHALLFFQRAIPAPSSYSAAVR